MNRLRPRGFTLPELMTVVVIVGVMAGVAMVKLSRDRRQGVLDEFAGQIRDAVNQARRRSVATGTPYLVDVRQNTVAYCQLDPTVNPPIQTTCPTPLGTNCAVTGAALECESVGPVGAGTEAEVNGWSSTTDLVAGPITPIGAGRSLLFRRNGTVDSIPNTVVPDGFTVYLQGVPDAAKQRKVIVFAASGRPRLLDRW